MCIKQLRMKDYKKSTFYKIFPIITIGFSIITFPVFWALTRDLKISLCIIFFIFALSTFSGFIVFSLYFLCGKTFISNLQKESDTNPKDSTNNTKDKGNKN